MNDKVRSFVRFSWLVIAVNLVVIAGGAMVRATGSGAGCGSHWPDCNGEIVPLAPSLETTIEYTHRTTSGLALLLVLAQVVWAFRLFPRAAGPHVVRRSAVLGLVFILLEALIGAALVKLELVGTNASMWRALIVGGHLVNTFLLVGALTATPLLAARMESSIRMSSMPLRTAWTVAVVLLLMVGAAGAITALGDTLFPSETLAAGMAADTAHDAHLLVRLRIVHPLLAVLAYFYLIGLSVMGPASLSQRPDAAAALKPAARLVTALATAQIACGFLDLLLLAPLWLQMVHLVLADVVWMALIAMGLRLASLPTGATQSREQTA